MRCLSILTLLFGGLLFAEANGHENDLVARGEGREDSGMSDEYKLYDRNQAGLDWNRYSYPSSDPRQQPPINR